MGNKMNINREHKDSLDRIHAGKTTEEAVDEAVQQYIEERVLADFLCRHRAEGNEMVMPEHAEEIHIKNLMKISRAEGRAEAIRAMLELCREMDMPETAILKKISERFQMDENQVAEFL